MLVKRGADPTMTDDSGRIAADMTDDAELAAGLRYDRRVSPGDITLNVRISSKSEMCCAGLLKALLTRTTVAALLPDATMSKETENAIVGTHTQPTFSVTVACSASGRDLHLSSRYTKRYTCSRSKIPCFFLGFLLE